MKILKSFALILLMVVVLGCSKDDDKNNDSTTSLVGTWKLTAEKIDGENQELDACEYQKGLQFLQQQQLKLSSMSLSMMAQIACYLQN